MSYDLEYFAEFLADPSVPDIADFYDMVRKWGEYIREHKDEFDYLADDEWKEIRERLIIEFGKREIVKKSIDAEWEETGAAIENITEANDDDEALEAMNKHLSFMKTYRKLYKFTDEDINLLEKDIADFKERVKIARIAEENVRKAKLALEKSIANLDDFLAEYQERTGKPLVLPMFHNKKKNKGN